LKDLKENRENGEKMRWADIAKYFKSRTVRACEKRYNDKLKEGEKKDKSVAWTADDDSRLKDLKENEKKSWEGIAKHFNGRTAVACQLRYINYVKDGAKMMMMKKKKQKTGSSNTQQQEITVDDDAEDPDEVWV
jgi:hypothetical protein